MLKSFVQGAALFALLVSCSHSPQDTTCPEIVVAAFDIGSGSTKLRVGTKKSCTHEIIRTLEDSSVPVGYAQDLSESKDGAFSDEIVEKGGKAIRKLLSVALSHEPDVVLGVATQAFREATNANEVVKSWTKRFGIPVAIISQDQEAQLAYDLVATKVKAMPKQRLVVWDIGGGSQQLVTQDKAGNYQFIKSQTASVTFKNKVIKRLNIEDLKSPNPLGEDGKNQALALAKSLIESSIGPDVREMLSSDSLVVGLGGVHGASLKNQLGLKTGEAVTMEALDKAIQKRIFLDDQGLKSEYAETDVTNLILVKALMESYGIDTYQIISTSLSEALIATEIFSLK